MVRGIDLEGLDGVISYDLPTYAKTYIHRVGMTARAGKEGGPVVVTGRTSFVIKEISTE